MSKSFNTKLDGILKTHRLDVEIAANTEIDPFFEANITLKAAIKQLIKELVAEARIDELKHLVDDDGIWYQDMTRQFPQKITLNQRIKELEQNLLKALEEV